MMDDRIMAYLSERPDSALPSELRTRRATIDSIKAGERDFET